MSIQTEKLIKIRTETVKIRGTATHVYRRKENRQHFDEHEEIGSELSTNSKMTGDTTYSNFKIT